MSDYDENEHDENEESVKKNPLRGVLKQKEKELNEALAELKKYREASKASTVATLIETAGGDSAYAKFYTAEDASEEAVKAWIEANSKLIGIKAPEQEDPARAQVEALANAVNTAPQVKVGSQADLAARLASAKTRDEYEAVINAAFKTTRD